jgi:hypothetical protein
MSVTASGVALVVVSLIVLFAVVAALVWAQSLATRPGPFLTFATAAATAADFSSFLHLLYFSVERQRATCPAGVARGRHGRRRLHRDDDGPEDVSSSVKVALLLGYGLADTIEACRSPAGGPDLSRSDLRARFARSSAIVRQTYVPDLAIVTTQFDAADDLAALTAAPV